MREMQEGTVADVKDTRSMLHDVQKQTLELIELQKGKTHELINGCVYKADKGTNTTNPSP